MIQKQPYILYNLLSVKPQQQKTPKKMVFFNSSTPPIHIKTNQPDFCEERSKITNGLNSKGQVALHNFYQSSFDRLQKSRKEYVLAQMADGIKSKPQNLNM